VRNPEKYSLYIFRKYNKINKENKKERKKEKMKKEKGRKKERKKERRPRRRYSEIKQFVNNEGGFPTYISMLFLSSSHICNKTIHT
jgi:hypothetical protein